MADVDNTLDDGSRNKKSRRLFIQADGTKTPRAGLKTVGFSIEVLEDGEVLDTIEHLLSDFNTEVLNAAAAFGLVTSITNTFGSSKISSDEAVEAARARVETFLDGEWSADRQAGVRTSDILEAFVAMRSAAGRSTSDERKADFVAQIKAGEIKVPDLLKSEPLLKAEYDAIKAKRAAERAAASKARASGASQAPSTLLDD